MKRFILLFALVASLQLNSSLQANDDYSYPYPNLSLSAKAQIQKPADEFFLKIGVVTTKDTAKDALAENNIQIAAVIEVIRTAGITDGEYQTGRFSIHPTYTPYPKDPPPNWKSTINGYEVTNSITIQSKKLDIIGACIDGASKAGATTIEDIRFVLGDPEQYIHEAIEKATSKAIYNAQAMAKAAHVVLGRLLGISLETPPQTPIYQTLNFAKGMDMESLPPIEPGNVTLSATVHMVYEISVNILD